MNVLSLTGMVNRVEIFLNEEMLRKILGVHVDGIKSVKDKQPFLCFVQSTFKVSGDSKARVRKFFLNGEF